MMAVLMWPEFSVAAAIDVAGFGSFVYGKTFSDDTKLTDKKSGMYGMTNDGGMRDLSLMGLRVNSNLSNSDLSFTAQAVVYGADNFKPTFDWAYGTYHFDQGWEVSLGRTRTPLFMYSAFQDVSYAYPWIKAPHSVYGVPQFKSIDGLNVRHKGVMGEWASDFQFWMGNIREDLNANGLESKLILNRSAGLAWSVERDWLLLRAVYMQADSSVDLTSNDSLSDLIQLANTIKNDPAYSAQTRQLIGNFIDQMEWEDKESRFYGVGIALDFGNYFVGSEATLVTIGDNVAVPEDLESYYILLGTRIVPKWTFSLTLVHDRDRAQHDLIDDYGYFISPLIDPADPLLSALPSAQAFESFVVNLQQYTSVGYSLTARWDFHRSASAKLEFLHEQREYGDNYLKTYPRALRLGVDFVF